MPPGKIPADVFIESVRTIGINKTSKRFGLNCTSVKKRRRRLEQTLGQPIAVPDWRNTSKTAGHPYRLDIEVSDGHVIIGSDGHYWPGRNSTAHRAFVKFCKEHEPKTVIFNGDALDGARISRHAPIGWESRPTLINEIEACKERLGEIESVSKRGCRRIWLLGNHDGRFETRLATLAPEYANIHGMHLHDHFALWETGWAAWINDDVVIKHRFKGGVHAARNNTLYAGKTIITGHLHSLKVSPFSDYNGTRWGVDTGCLADPYDSPFVDYTEDNPRDWRSGFTVLTFYKGRLLWPELVSVFDENHVEFRGKVIAV